VGEGERGREGMDDKAEEAGRLVVGREKMEEGEGVVFLQCQLKC
jgi:hypothetical protein